MIRQITRTLLIAIGATFYALAHADSPDGKNLNCDSGPLAKTFGGTPWLIYGCDDGHSLVIATSSDSPAMPFYFFFVWGPNGFELRGEGTGNKKLTDAAFEDLKALSEKDIASLYTGAAAVGGKP